MLNLKYVRIENFYVGDDNLRLWSIHPKYLDSKGLVALWREGLLAKKVLEGKTKGYKNHPQLERFKKHSNPLIAINAYLFEVWKEAQKRGYNFDVEKIKSVNLKKKISVTRGQLEYEFQHLLKKLQTRDKKLYEAFKGIKNIKENPVFLVIEGEIESWEKVYFQF